MKTPFTLQQFLDVFKAYNETVFPLQLLLYILAVILLVLVGKKVPKVELYTNAILAFFWMWMGFVYHLLFFTTINKAAYGFGSLFIIQSGLFLYYGISRHHLVYRFSRSGYSIAGLFLIAYALVFYPLIGYFSDHAYPYAPTFGLPCPTTIFTIGLLLSNEEKLPVPVIIIPVLWTVLGFFAAFSLGIHEDLMLPLAGLLLLLSRLYPDKHLALHL